MLANIWTQQTIIGLFLFKPATLIVEYHVGQVSRGQLYMFGPLEAYPQPTIS